MLFPVWRGHQQLDVLADYLGLGVAEHLFGRPICGLDHALDVNCDDRVKRGVPDGFKMFVLLAQGLRTL